MSILDVLRRRKQERTVSADEFVRQAIRSEAAGDTKGLDVGQLEQSLSAIGWSLDQFEQAVSRQREVDRLRAIISSKAEASQQFREAADHAAATRTEHMAEIERLRGEIEQAQATAETARREVDRIRQAEEELRQFEGDRHRAARSESKRILAALRDRQRSLRAEIEQARREIDRVDGTVLTPTVPADPLPFHEGQGLRPKQRDEYVAARQQTIASASEQLQPIEAELARLGEQVQRSEREAVGA